MIIKRFCLMAIPLMLLAACGETDTGSEEGDVTETGPAEGALETVAENLEAPWSIDQYEDTFYISERAGSIMKIDAESTERQEVELSDEVSNAPEAGLLGFTLSPDFETSNEAFAYYTYEDDEEQFNRVVTLALSDGIWSEDEILLDGMPGGQVHHGGRLAIGPDEYLYITAGDAAAPVLSQQSDSLGGSILRMNLDGSVPSDNPFDDSYVYSYGHRNPQGLSWSEDGTLYASEHGENANDEINLIEAGNNYGWPVIEGDEEEEGMEPPLFTSGDDTWAPSGMSYHENGLYVAALRGNALIEFDFEAEDYNEIITDVGRVRDVMSDEEYLYFISNNTDGRGEPDEADDKLYRLPLAELE